MQDIRQETLNECTRAEQSASVVLWEIDLTEVGGERYFFCNEQNEKGEPVKRRTKNAKAFHDKCENFSFRASNETAVLITAFYSLHGDHLGYG